MNTVHTRTVSSREFARNVSGAKRLARQSPLFIADRGDPTFVLMHMDEYRRLTHTGKTMLDLLTMPESDGIDFDPAPARLTAQELDVDEP